MVNKKSRQKKQKKQKATAIVAVVFAGANFSSLNALICQNGEKNKF